MRWVDALKEWNKGSPTWCIARKGTKAYDEVKAIMAGKKIEAAAEPKAEAKPMAQGIDMREVQRKRKQKAKLEELKQSAKDTVASAMASIPAPAPRKNMMPSMMASIADIAKKAKAAKEKAWTAKTRDGKVYKRTIGGVVYLSDYLNQLWLKDADGSVGDWVGVYLPSENRIDTTASDPFEEVVALPVMKEKQNTSKTELEEELDVGFVYKPVGRRMEQSIFEDIVRMAGEMERAEDKETSNGEMERHVPRAIKELKVGDTLCRWFITAGTTWSNYVHSPNAGMSKEEARMETFYTIVSIHNNHTTFRVESSNGDKKILRLQIYRERNAYDFVLHSFVLSDGWPWYVSSNYVPTKSNATSSQITEAYDVWERKLDNRTLIGPRIEMLYDDMMKRQRIAQKEIYRGRDEEARVKREKDRQETIQKIKSMIEEGGGLQKLKKEALRKIISEYSSEMDPMAYARLWDQHIGGGRYSKTLPSKEKMLAMIGAFNLQ
jgi:hypothetical protein